MKHATATTPLLTLCLLAMLCGNTRSQEAPSSPLVLKGSTMAAVKFPHSAHTRVAGKCEVCHHPSKPDKPLKAPQEACNDCHTKPPTPPVTVGLETAFHNSTATAGLCITCHKTENSHGKAAPVQCADCHKKESS